MNNKWFSIGSFRLTLLSMFVSVLCYGLTMELLTATVFVTLLFVHEMGHVLFARWKNISVSIPVFIPFVGAFIAIDERDLDTPQNEAWVGLGGPLVGGLAAGCAFVVWALWFPHSVEVALGINFAFFLNVFNMLPVRPFDGGRIVQVMGKWAEALGVFLLILYTYFHFNFIMGVIWIMVLTGRPREEYKSNVGISEKVLWGLGYIVLCATLMMAMAFQVQLFNKFHSLIK